MRLHLLALTVTMASAQPLPQTANGVIHGTVRRAGGGAPIAGAQISLTPVGANMPSGAKAIFAAFPPGAQLTPALLDAVNAAPPDPVRATPNPANATPRPAGPLAATTDADGRFVIKDVPPGQYAAGLRCEGYFNPSVLSGAPGNATAVTTAPIYVVAGQATPEVALTMVKGGAIAGRVRDHNLQALPGVSIAAYQIAYRDGQAILNRMNIKETDDRGEYRLFWLAPGEYYVAAMPRLPGATPGPQDSLAKTYFPRAVDPRYAERVVVNEGGNVEGLNIDLQTVRKATISGRVINTVPDPGGKPQTAAILGFLLVPRDPNVLQDNPGSSSIVMNSATDRANGQFELRAISSGSYDLIVTVQYESGGKPYLGSTKVDVGTNDLRDVTLTVRPGVEVKGRIVYSGGTPPANAASAQVRLLAKENYAALFNSATQQNLVSVAIQADGTVVNLRGGVVVPPTDPSKGFVFSNVPEARYTFQVSGLPVTAYVSDIREGGASIFDAGLAVGTQSPGPIEVLVDLTGATVEGVVRDAEQKPVLGARVVLVPQQSRRGNPALYKTTATDLAGHFTLQGVAPGEYKVFAWAAPPLATAYMNAEFIARYESRGQLLRVSAGGRADIQVSVIPPENPTTPRP